MEQQVQPVFFEKNDLTASAQVGALLPPSQGPTAEFDYSGVEAGVVEHARDTAAFVRRIEPAIGVMVCEAGSRLCEVKKRLGHGRFGTWLASHGINPRTAQNYMNLRLHSASATNTKQFRIFRSAFSTGCRPAPWNFARASSKKFVVGPSQTISCMLFA